MNFENPTTPEKESNFPSLEEIESQIERLSANENLESIRTLEDEKGVYLHEVVATDEDGDGLLYSYRRSGNYSETKALVTTIDVAYFKGKIEEGMFMGGSTLSDYNEETGKWTDKK